MSVSGLQFGPVNCSHMEYWLEYKKTDVYNFLMLKIMTKCSALKANLNKE